jgi:hypothetical protein
MVTGQHCYGQFAKELALDPGIDIIRKLISSVRSSMIVNTFKLTTRLIILYLGIEKFRSLLREYWKKYLPEPFASAEGKKFARYIEGRQLPIPYLKDILKLERAILYQLQYEKNQKIDFGHDPYNIINSLANRRKPTHAIRGNFEVEVKSNGILTFKTTEKY